MNDDCKQPAEAGRADMSADLDQRRSDCGTETMMEEIALIGDTERCVCKPAVIRAFEGMTASGAPDRNAFEVAMRVLQYHHPEMPNERIKITVERWLHQGEMH